MKNITLLSCVLLTTITMHCMQLDNPIAVQKPTNPPSYSWENIDYSIVEKSLENDCNLYLNNRLEEYKKVDFTSDGMDQMKQMCSCITGKPTYFDSMIKNIHDENKNRFSHCAVQKTDLNGITWLIKHKSLSYSKNRDNKEPIDLCIDQLLPHAAESHKKITLAILKLLIAKNNFPGFLSNNRKKDYLTKLVTLQLEHTKHDTAFKLEDAAFAHLISSATILSEIHQTIVDEEKNSYTHILVQKKLADMLYEFIKKDYITFAVNNTGQHPLTIAQENFQYYTKQITSPTVPSYPADFTPTRCCLFMLLNYVKKQKNISYEQCCEKHTI